MNENPEQEQKFVEMEIPTELYEIIKNRSEKSGKSIAQEFHIMVKNYTLLERYIDKIIDKNLEKE